MAQKGTATMRGTASSTGQMAELTTSVNGALAVALPKVAEKFGDPKAVLAGIKDKTQVLAGRLEIAFEEVIRSMMALIRRPQRSITISERRDPYAYYRTRPGLWVYDGFRNLIASNAKPVKVGTVFKVNEDELGKDMNDAETEACLPKNHLFDESSVGAIVAELIESGQLDKGKRYLLYTASSVVRVFGRSGNRGYCVDAWKRDAFRWHAGICVFSPAN